MAIIAKAWERQKSESSKAYAWFKVYRDLGASRSLKKVISKIENDNEKNELKGNERNDENIIPLPTYKALENMSRKWHWAKRGRRWDNYLDELARQQKKEEYLQLEDRLIEVGSQFVDVIEKNIEELETNFEQSKATSVAHSLSSSAKAFDNVTKNLRLLYGRSTEIKDEKSEVSLDAEVDSKKEVHVDVTSDEFMEKELDMMKELVDRRKNDSNTN